MEAEHQIKYECNICYEKSNCHMMPCCENKFICSSCLTKLSNKLCPYCQKKINIKTYVKISKCPNINYNQLVKVTSMLFYILTSIICVFLMGYGLEMGMNEMSMFVIDMIVFITLNICHIGIWNVIITIDGNQTIMADHFGYKYYLGGILQNSIYIFFFYYFNNHFFLNSMSFIMICYNFVIFPIYNGIICIIDQISKILYYREEIIVDTVTYNNLDNQEPLESDYRNISIL